LDPPYDIRLVFVQKITFVLRKINKNCRTFRQLAALSAPRSPAVFRGPTSKGRGRRGVVGVMGEEQERKGKGVKGEGGREFALFPRKKKEKSAPTIIPR